MLWILQRLSRMQVILKVTWVKEVELGFKVWPDSKACVLFPVTHLMHRSAIS
jgi:hypothetical protein